jgi:hypothetical protein
MVKNTPINLGCDMAMGRIWSLTPDEQLRIENPVLYKAKQEVKKFDIDDIADIDDEESEMPF